jgi:hypothetical protein
MHRAPIAVSRTARAAVRRVHRRLCARLAEAALAPDAQLAIDFAAIVATVEAGLRHEETVLERLGHPGIQICIADNAVLLRALHRVLPHVEAGDGALGRDALGALHDVLSLRRLACDVALAAMASPVHAGSPRMRAHIRRPSLRENRGVRSRTGDRTGP